MTADVGSLVWRRVRAGQHEADAGRRLTPGQAARLAPWLGPLRAVRARGKDANGKGVRR